MTRPPLPRLHVVTDDAVLARPDFRAVAAAILEGAGGNPPPVLALHVRGPGTSGRAIFDHVQALLPVARGYATLLFVNDRVDVALATSPDGIHLGRRSLHPRDARSLLGSDPWLGASAGSADEVGDLTREGADYTFLGTIWPTASHPGREGSGPGALASAVERAGGRPVLAIGGVTPERAREVRAAGAWGIAVLGGVWNAERPADAVARYLEALETM